MMTPAHIHVWLHAYADWERELAAEAAMARLAAAGNPTKPIRAGLFTHVRWAAGNTVIRLGKLLVETSLTAGSGISTTLKNGG